LHGTPVAVKRLKTKVTETVVQSFNHEVGLMSDIKNPYCLLLIGACIQYPHLCIITEYVPNGSLREWLDRNTLLWPQLLKFAITTARGMAWLHSRKPAVLHRDLHSNNVLVTENLDCKVADFGLSQIQGQVYQSRAMYKRIVPPELLKGELFTKKSDVYMYGLVLLELLTAKKPDPKSTNLISSLDHTSPHFKNSPGRHAFIDLIKSCCSVNPLDRPHFLDILTILDRLQEKDHEQTREEIIAKSKESKGEYVD